MTRLIRRTLSAYVFALFALVMFLGAAWYAVMGALYTIAHYPGADTLIAVAALSAYLAVHPDRTPKFLGRKALQ